jgi:uncharacterized membrane protein
MYITGVGVFVVAATTLDDKAVVAALTAVTAVFMVGNYVGFLYNFRSQKSIYEFLKQSILIDNASYKLVEDGRPLRIAIFTTGYVIVSLVVLTWAIFYFQYQPHAQTNIPSVNQNKIE